MAKASAARPKPRRRTRSNGERGDDAMSDAHEVPHAVVVNHEEQYAIWPAERELPAGWRHEGTVGSRAECLAHIETVWTDMRPLSLRQQMDGSGAASSS